VPVWLAVASLLGGARIYAADDAPVATVSTITVPGQVWALSNAQKSIVHPLRLEGRVSYIDRRWALLWLGQGENSFIQLSTNAPLLKQGQRVLIEGTILPTRGLDAASVTVKVLQENEPVEPISVAGRLGDLVALKGRIVTTEAFVDSQQLVDDDHLMLSLIVENQPVTGYVKPQDPRSPPDWRERFIQITAMYEARLDPTQTHLQIDFWTARQSDVVVLDSLADSRRFELPLRPINGIGQQTRGQDVRVRGRVMAMEPGLSITLRDDTGQVEVRSAQSKRIALGTEVEAVGRVIMTNAQWVLESALYRAAHSPASDKPETDQNHPVLQTVGQIRQLSVDDAAEGRPVLISGVVTWSLPDLGFFFLQDITGGIRVRYRPEQMRWPQRNKYLEIKGVTYNGGFAPAVDLQDYRDLGSMNEPPVREITLDQAIRGELDGQLVYMRGFYRSTESDGDFRKVHLITPAGEFVGLVKSSVNFVATPGSLVRVNGVCEVVADENGRITGVAIRVGSLPGFRVEEDAPADYYDLPLRSIKRLRQLNTARELTRVRVAGVVLHAVPGSFIYLQEDNAGLLLLSHESMPVSPGDKIEAVGILGWEGIRTILREAVYRKTGVGPLPAPVLINDPTRLSVAFDSRLVRVRGILIDAVRRPEQTRLTLQSGNTLFEAMLDGSSEETALREFTPGAGLELTGIYRIGFDDSHQSRSFQLQLRSLSDIVVFQQPRLWTVQRALLATAILGGCTLLGLAWITALRRRVRQQTAQIRAQLERQAKLEAEVQRATRLESLGVLAGGIAHDFNNLLTIVMGNLTLAMLDEKAMSAVGDCLRESQRGAIRARDLTQQLLTFAKGGNPLRAAVALPTIVRETAEFILHGSNARCDYDLPDELWNASVDRDQIAQVIQNLVLNAMQAMPNGGIIRISLRNEEIAPKANSALAPGRYLRLAIADSGHGIPPENLPRIFDPYFSTKRAGSGLGLATVYSIVKKHQGHVQVESAPGRGATFTLWLPAADPNAAGPAPSRAPATASLLSPGRTARVLLMDDEDSIRRLGAALLQRLDLEPTVVADGAEAVREFRQARDSGHPFSLVILDLTIPGAMGGREAIDFIRFMDDKVPAIVSSGYSNDPVLANFRAHGFQAMVPKPYDVNELGETIRQLLAHHGAPRDGNAP
jgi:signal transduction histidine kinase/CheY-like chemotaxis protein